MYKIEWKESAIKELEKLEAVISKRVYAKISELSKKPFSVDIKKLKGMQGYRLRIGDYRVIFEVNQNTIIIFKVGHRKNIYER